jgi:hypothetical protein
VSSGRRHTREDSGLRLDRQLRWWHDDEPIEHPNIIRAFERGLRLDDDGRFRLEFGPDWAFVQVEACAFRVLAVDISQGERLSLRLSDLTAEWLDPQTLAEDEDGALTVKVKGGRASARFTRDSQVQLGQFLAPGDGHLVLQVGASAWPTSLAAS